MGAADAETIRGKRMTERELVGIMSAIIWANPANEVGTFQQVVEHSRSLLNQQCGDGRMCDIRIGDDFWKPVQRDQGCELTCLHCGRPRKGILEWP